MAHTAPALSSLRRRAPSRSPAGGKNSSMQPAQAASTIQVCCTQRGPNATGRSRFVVIGGTSGCRACDRAAKEMVRRAARSVQQLVPITAISAGDEAGERR